MADYGEIKVIKVYKLPIDVKKNPIKFCYAVADRLTMDMKKKIDEIRK